VQRMKKNVRPRTISAWLLARLLAGAWPRVKVWLSQGQTGQPQAPNDNLDTGETTPRGEYFMNDDAHAKLLEALAKDDFASASPEVRAELLQFHADPNAPYATKRKPKKWKKVDVALQKLRASAVPSENHIQ